MLLYKPAICPDECPLSYLIRVGHANGFKNISQLLRFAGLSWRNNRVPIHEILTGEFDLAEYFGRLELPILPLNPPLVYQTFRRIIDTPYLFVRNPKLCPLCLAEEGVCRSVWVYMPILSCEKHRVFLVDHNPETGESLSWYRGCLDKFNSADESKISLTIPAPKEIARISGFFASLLGSAESLSSSAVPEVLSGLKLNEALSLFNFLAHYRERLVGSNFTPVSLDNLALAEKYKKIWHMLNDWPDSFYSMLAQYIDRPALRAGARGVNRHFGGILERLQRQEKNIGVARIKIEFNRFVQEYWPGTLLADNFVRLDIVNHRKIISKTDAARVIGCRVKTIDKYVLQGRLPIRIFNGKCHFYREDVEGLAEIVSANWTMEEACEALQISRFLLKQLIDAELIPIVQRSDELNRDWIINKVGTQNFISTLVSRGSNVIIDTGQISLGGIQRMGFSIANLIKGMMSGDIKFYVKPNSDQPFSFRQFCQFEKPAIS